MTTVGCHLGWSLALEAFSATTLQVMVELERRQLLQALASVGKQLGLQRGEIIRDDASRVGVLAFMGVIRATPGPTAAKSDAEKTYTAFVKTFDKKPPGSSAAAAHAGAAPTATASEDKKGLRGKSFLFTYNWDFFGLPLPDGTPPFSSEQALWDDWLAAKTSMMHGLQVVKDSDTLERSLNSGLVGRVHIHRKVDLKEAIDHRTKDAALYHGILPNVSTTLVPVSLQKKARGANFQQASNRLHFYTWAPKLGTVFVSTNYLPFRDYRVQGKWLEDLWGDHKLSHDDYESLSLRVRLGHSTRKRDRDLVRAEETEARMLAKKRDIDEALKKITKPFRIFDQVTAWEDSFLKLGFRWKILVLTADSSSGKSTFAEHRFDNPYVLTVEDAEILDLRGFESEVHDGIVLDNVNSWGQLLRWRAKLQGRNAVNKGGQTPSGMYSYPQHLFGVPIVATIDLDAPDKYLVDPQDARCSNWLVTNLQILRLAPGEAFFDRTETEAVHAPNTFSLFAETVKKRRASSSS